MSEDFSQLTTDLQVLINQLKHRCLEAEARVKELEILVAQQQDNITQLEAGKTDIETKYNHLRSGVAATQGDPAQVAKLKEDYLAMVSEIDACIAMLQHG